SRRLRATARRARAAGDRSRLPPEAPLQGFDIQLSPEGAVVDAQYASNRDLGKIPLDMIESQLQQELALPNLSLKATRARNSYRILEEAKRAAEKNAKKIAPPVAQKP
ncbi:MAG: hypothetical protein ACRD27_12195, partial [Terracidiphilus sp.]